MIRMTFVQPTGEEEQVEAEAGGSIMDAAVAHGIAGVTAECGGAATCGTCHVHVAEDWLTRLNPPEDMEAQMLEFVIDPRPNSRLSCQITLTQELDGIILHLPNED